MSSFCKISSDKRAQGLCESLEKDGYLSAAPDTEQVYRRTIEVAEERDRKGLSLDFLRDRVEIPWIPDDLNPKTSEDQDLRKWVADQVASIRADLSKKGVTEGTFAYRLELGRRIFESFRRGRDEGGFGLSFDAAETFPRSLVQIYRDRKATCLDFANLYLMAAGIAGLPVVPVELLRSGNKVQHHLAVAFLDPASTTNAIHTIVDLQPPASFGPPPSWEVWSPLSKLDLVVHFYNAKGVRDLDATKGEVMIDLALSLSPRNYLALFNKSYWEALRGNYLKAKGYLLASITSNPIYSRSYWNLHVIADATNDEVTSRWALGEWKRITG